MKTPVLDFYYEYLETGHLPTPGLCFTAIANYDELEDFEPKKEDEDEPLFWDYWGLDEGYVSFHDFTPLRQNIVLFIAAMRGELD